jgi:hypothetical protein
MRCRKIWWSQRVRRQNGAFTVHGGKVRLHARKHMTAPTHTRARARKPTHTHTEICNINSFPAVTIISATRLSVTLDVH